MKKITATFTFLFGISNISSACPLCNKKVMDGIYNSQFYPNIFIMLSAFLVLGLIVAVLTAIAAKTHTSRLATDPGVVIPSPVPLTTTAMVLGIGIGGLMDGIVLHQILQGHSMLSNKIPATDYIGKSINMFWDGIFHFFCALVILVGITLIWKLLFRKDIERSGKLLVGGLFLGWGLFNITEGVIDHHILKLHNVFEFSPNHDIGNFAFLGISVLMIIFGYFIVNKRSKTT